MLQIYHFMADNECLCEGQSGLEYIAVLLYLHTSYSPKVELHGEALKFHLLESVTLRHSEEGAAQDPA